jgi:trk system potassium uptake protein TrkH
MQKRWLTILPLVIALLAIFTVIFDVGFEQSTTAVHILDLLYLFFLLFIVLHIPLRYILKTPVHQRLQVWITDGILWVFYALVFLSRFLDQFAGQQPLPALAQKIWLVPVFTFNLVREISRFGFWFRNRKINPALLFVSSFFALITLGTFLLMMPRATHSGISFTNAFFTATSAVCVTGLIVVDTGTYFTQFGQIFILLLVQLGGLGIMTFTSFFVFFFSGGTSFQSMIVIGHVTNENKIARVFSTLFKILVFTISFEAAGILLVYLTLDGPEAAVPGGRLFFSVFHAISAFCNSGFSTLSTSFYDMDFRFNYSLHLVIALLFVIGGLGFPVMFNCFNYLKHLVHKGLTKLNQEKKPYYHHHVINLNTRIVLLTTLILIVAGTVGFFMLEYGHTLSEHHGPGKLVTAFFSAVTPRTAGFNTVDTASLRLPTMLLVILLMWIGASPASTGGGVKTSTFALAVLNATSLIRGRDRVEIFRREIPAGSLHRASGFIILSLIVIATAIFMLLLTDPDKSFSDVLFEVFSAFSTVGLSRGITGDLSLPGKWWIIITMFIGRVGTLTFLVAFFRKPKSTQYQLPTEDILIN